MGKRGDDFIIILNVNRIFSTSELALVNPAEEPALVH